MDKDSSDPMNGQNLRLSSRIKGLGPMSFGSAGATAGLVGPEVLAMVERHWRDCTAGRRVALRSDIDPSRIEMALPATMILERIAPGVARIRVAGQEISKLCGMDPRGMPLSVLFTGPAREMLRAHLESTFSGPAIVQIPLQGPRRLLRAGATGHMLLLPLDDGTGEISRALAVLITDRAVDRQSPVRFDIPADAKPRIDVLAPVRFADRPQSGPREPTRAETEERRAAANPPVQLADRRADLRRRFRLFEVVQGDGQPNATLTAAEPRPALSLVVSNAEVQHRS